LSPAWIKISPGFRKRQVPRDTCGTRSADEDVLQHLKSKDGQIEEECVCDGGCLGDRGLEEEIGIASYGRWDIDRAHHLMQVALKHGREDAAPLLELMHCILDDLLIPTLGVLLEASSLVERGLG
jgi:hypothetical protein